MYSYLLGCSFIACVPLLRATSAFQQNKGTEKMVKVEENSSIFSECTSCCQHGHTGNKTALQQNSPFLSWGCQLTEVVLDNGCKTLQY